MVCHRLDSAQLAADLASGQYALVQLRNCSILRSGSDSLQQEDVWLEGGRIVNPEVVFFEQRRLPDLQIDCQGLILAPGFIEMQLNGGFGFDFTSDRVTDEEYLAGVERVSSGLLAHGCTSYCPTVISSRPQLYHKLLPLLKPRPGGAHGAAVLGAHLEGPFISADRRGAHPVQHVRRELSAAELQSMYGPALLHNTSIVTVAPELPGATAAVGWLTQNGVTVSLGHSACHMATAEAAVQAGARCVTHLFNAMEPYHHRDPSLIGLLASDLQADIYYGIIADGVHTHDSALRIAQKTHSSGLILTTDSIIAMGVGDGEHEFGDLKVSVVGKRCTLEPEGTLAGGVSTIDSCVRHLRRATGCSVVQALECATLHPARMLQLEHTIGTLNFGAQADLVLLTHNLQPKATFIAGQLVWRHTQVDA